MVANAVAVIERKRILRVLIVDQNVDDVRRVRELLWENVPEHIKQLRLALKLGT